MNMLNLHIDAADTLFFRDGRPFTMGEDTSVESASFPPLPSVVYGALRSAYLAQNAHLFDLNKLIELSNDLRIKNIALRTSGDSTFYTMPKDLVVPKNQKNAKRLSFSFGSNFISSSVTQQFLFNNASEKIKDDEFIVLDSALNDYLKGSETNINAYPLKDYLCTETKLGIGRNNGTRTSTDGLLYRIGMVRPHTSKSSIGIEVSFENLEINGSSLFQLGGEKKIAFSKIIDASKRINLPDLGSNSFKIYLATPAIFKSGWKPEDILEKYNLELLTAAIGKPINVGGWDIKTQKPKPMLKAIPAGSVYYVKAESIEAAKNAAKQIFEQCSISEFADSAQQGFGIAFIGKI